MPQQICRLAAVVVGSMAAFAAQETSLNCLKMFLISDMKLTIFPNKDASFVFEHE